MESEARIKINTGLRNVIESLGSSLITPSAYDTAWMAMVSKNEKPIFAFALYWIVENQKDDGSWGSTIEYYHDSILSTLASILVLKKYNKSDIYQDQILRGESYVVSNIENLGLDRYETIGFEMIFTTMIKEVWGQNMCLSITYSFVDKYIKLKKRKLSILPPNILQKNLSILHSLEFLGDDILILDEDILESNYSIGCSPSATAYYFSKTNDIRVLSYLSEFERGKEVPTAYPINFEDTWVLYLVGLLEDHGLDGLDSYQNALLRIKTNWKIDGLSWSYFFTKSDLDLSSVAYNVLNKHGINKPFKVFNEYKNADLYECYPYELNSSVSANIHLLHALVSETRVDKKKVDEVINFIKNKIDSSGLLFDKWHISPFYPSSRLVIALLDLRSSSHTELLKRLINSILFAQGEDGAWGWYGGTLEETAYALMAIKLFSKREGRKDFKKTISRGEEYLLENLETENYPELWVGKVLYTPVNVVKATIYCSLLI